MSQKSLSDFIIRFDTFLFVALLHMYTSGGPVLKFPGRSVLGYLYFRLVGSRLFKIWIGYLKFGSVIFGYLKFGSVIFGYFCQLVH